MNEVFICAGVRTPIGRYGGALSSVRTDDLAAIPLRHLKRGCLELIGIGLTMSCSGV